MSYSYKRTLHSTSGGASEFVGMNKIVRTVVLQPSQHGGRAFGRPALQCADPLAADLVDDGREPEQRVGRAHDHLKDLGCIVKDKTKICNTL